MRFRYLEIAPTLVEIDILLSFRMNTTFSSISPALLSASYAMPPVIDPSPMMPTTLWSLPSWVRAAAMPSAADNDVVAWPAPKASYGLSSRFRNPDRPPNCLSVWNSL